MTLNKNIEIYKKTLFLYNKAGDIWKKLENSDNIEFILAQFFNVLKKLRKYLDLIEPNIFSQKLDKDKMEKLNHNLSVFREGQLFMEKKAKGIKYADYLKNTVPGYIKRLKLDRDMNRDLGELSKEFISIIAHPKNILDYESSLKNMGKGSMPDITFKKIFNTLIRPVGISKKKRPVMGAGHEETSKRIKKWYKSGKNVNVGFRIKEDFISFKKYLNNINEKEK